jgi:hypothetical protein
MTDVLFAQPVLHNAESGWHASHRAALASGGGQTVGASLPDRCRPGLEQPGAYTACLPPRSSRPHHWATVAFSNQRESTAALTGLPECQPAANDLAAGFLFFAVAAGGVASGLPASSFSLGTE